MASASMAVLPFAPVRQISTHGQRARVSSLNKFATRSRVSMTASVGSQVAVADDLLFKNYKPTCAFLFPGQGAQAVGMGAEAQTVPVAAELFKKANDILGMVEKHKHRGF